MALARTRGDNGSRHTADDVSAESLRDVAYEAIKSRIITCEFRPGSCINEAALSTLIGVGRNPVHRALDRLRIEGMIDVIPRKGIIVRPVVLHEILEMVEVRAINECYSVRLAAQRATQEDLQALNSIVKQARKAVTSRDTRLMMDLDHQFHVKLAQASRNAEMAELLKKLHERTLRFWFISYTSDHHLNFQSQHEAILDAVQRKDADEAAKLMGEHIEAFRRSVAKHLPIVGKLTSSAVKGARRP